MKKKLSTLLASGVGFAADGTICDNSASSENGPNGLENSDGT
jgi:hypothetical protein